jgi:hypothetical protein
MIVMRNDHQDALAVGLSVIEYAPEAKSAAEIRSLWRWVELRAGIAAVAEQDDVPVLCDDAISIAPLVYCCGERRRAGDLAFNFRHLRAKILGLRLKLLDCVALLAMTKKARALLLFSSWPGLSRPSTTSLRSRLARRGCRAQGRV